MKRFAQVLIMAATLALVPKAWAGDGIDQAQLVAKAANTVERIRSSEGRGPLVSDKLAHARAVLIIPDLVKGGFFFGAEYGSGVLLAKDPSGAWVGPAFYTIASGSFGLQIGAQDAENMFVIMTDKGLAAVMKNAFKLGAAADVSLIVVGAGAEASTTTNVGADIFAFSTSVGLYGGVTLAGSGIAQRDSWNADYYGGSVTPEEVVLQAKYVNPQAAHLKDVLAR